MRICKGVFKVLFIAWGLILFNAVKAFSQEYKYEIGGVTGMSHYMGDANKSRPFLNPGFSGGALFRYNFSFQWALKTNLITGHVSGNSDNTANKFPFPEEVAFQRQFFDLGTQLEFNLLPFSDKYAYTGTKPYTPYIFAGAGITYAAKKKEFISLNMPFGMGFKYKLKNRVNIGIEFSFRKLFADDFDVVNNESGFNLNEPYDIKSSKLKNQDWYSLTLLFLTWEFSSREDPCRGI